MNHSFFVTPGSFQKGGWHFETDYIPSMGMPYLMAHGLGEPVSDAKTTFDLEPGDYSVYVYTFNWVSPWKPEYAPGLFEIELDGTSIGTFGDAPKTWGWIEKQNVSIKGSSHTLVLHDITGYEGRCGGIYITKEQHLELPLKKELFPFYLEHTCAMTQDIYEADYVVCGGGFAGMCASIMAARRGLKTILIQDRPVVGGNNSSEARVWLGGSRNASPFEGIGNIVGELEPQKFAHYGSSNVGELYEDEHKLQVLLDAGVKVFLHTSLIQAQKNDQHIESICCWDTMEDRVFTVKGTYFADCTGDGTLGYLADADFEVTTNGHMGKSNVWYIQDTGKETTFPPCPWAISLYGKDIPGREGVPDIYNGYGDKSMGAWFWEAGMERDPIFEAERARDTNLRAMYGAWDAFKNHDHSYPTWKLGHSCVTGGMRESRRLLGDVVLTKADVHRGNTFDDGCVPSYWNFDVHYPDPRFYSAFVEGDGFLTHDYHENFNRPFFVPYRCFYSRNIENLFMAGRDVSVSHDALGTVRVMRTCGMMGEIIGLAAALCLKYKVTPRGLYQEHVKDLMNEIKSIPYNGIPRPTKNIGG